ncbi:hypothetical protein ACVWXO_000427 [Bradyrhizobium sp. LM2.7]
MAPFVCVHGVAQQLRGSEPLAREWGATILNSIPANGRCRGPGSAWWMNVIAASDGASVENLAPALAGPRQDVSADKETSGYDVRPSTANQVGAVSLGGLRAI